MRVLIDTTYAGRGPSGTATYLAGVIPALREAGVDVVEAANERRRPPAGGGAGSVRNLVADARWTQGELPRRARAARADVLHHALPAYAHRAPCPQVVTVHDLAFVVHPERFDARFARWAARAHRAAATRAAAVVVPTRLTAAEAGAHWGIPATRIVVAHHGPGQALPDVAPRPPEHVLYVGDAEPRKNLALLRAAELPLPLRIAGGAGERVDARGLAELYAGALALVHPSVHEGFGLTPLEAMVHGVPVVALRSAAVEEVCGAAARYVGDDAGEVTAALRELDADPALRAAMAALGRERAAGFSWARSAAAHVEAYERALALP
jgi:glycosyltransferase involved in cell wall biosynthesis